MLRPNTTTATAPAAEAARRRSLLAALDTRRGVGIALVLLLAAHLLLNLLWLRLDNHVIRIDEEFHASTAQDYFYAFTNPDYHTLRERLDAVLALETPYPPLLHVLGALSALALGYSHDSLALPNTIYFLLVVLGTYLIARKVFMRPTAFLAALITSLIPVLFGGSRYIALENLISVCSVWGLYFLLQSDNFRRWPYIIAFGVVNGLAISTKPNAFIYYLLPAMVLFSLGLRHAVKSPRPGAVSSLFLRGAICVGITAAMALPWYLYHFQDFTRYWMNEHKGGKTPFTFTHVDQPDAGPGRTLEDRVTNPALAAQKAQTAPVQSPAPGARPVATPQPLAPVEPTPAEPAPPAERPRIALELNKFFSGREWSAYPIMVINNGTFLPLGVLGAVGLVAGMWRYRRNRSFWIILLWLFGAYFLNTLLFRFINPRYAMPFIPALGIGAAAAVKLVPWTRLRAVVTAVVLVFLLAQYANISFLDLRRLDIWLAVLTDHFRVKYFHDEGLVITKSEVITGTYCFRAPARGENYVDRGFRIMAEREAAIGHPGGSEVKYISLSRQNNFGGFRNVESTYWPAPNPLLRSDLRDHPEQQFRFNRILRCNLPEEAAVEIPNADYIVAILDTNDVTAVEGPAHGYFDSLREIAGMEILDFSFTPPYGLLPGGMIAVLGRGDNNRYKKIPDLRGQEATTSQDDLAVNAMRLMALRNLDGTARTLSPAELADREDRLAHIFPLLQPAMAISPNINLIRVVFDQPYPGWYRIRLLFQVVAQPQHDWRIFVMGKFNPWYAHHLPKVAQDQGFVSWNFDPERPTSTWKPGDFILCAREFACPPIVMDNLSIGFFRNGTEGWGQAINTGRIDFRDFPVNPPDPPDLPQAASPAPPSPPAP